MPGHFEKQYLERNRKGWTRTTASMVELQMRRCFMDPERMMEKLMRGETILTAFAEYRWIEEV